MDGNRMKNKFSVVESFLMKIIFRTCKLDVDLHIRIKIIDEICFPGFTERSIYKTSVDNLPLYYVSENWFQNIITGN